MEFDRELVSGFVRRFALVLNAQFAFSPLSDEQKPDKGGFGG